MLGGRPEQKVPKCISELQLAGDMPTPAKQPDEAHAQRRPAPCSVGGKNGAPTHEAQKGCIAYCMEFRSHWGAHLFSCKRALHQPRRARTNVRKPHINAQKSSWPWSCLV